MEKLTRDLVESHLMSCIQVKAVMTNGDRRWYWTLEDSVREDRAVPVDCEFVARFTSFEAARNYAFGWIRRNRPDLERAAAQEAKDGIRYRASK